MVIIIIIIMRLMMHVNVTLFMASSVTCGVLFTNTVCQVFSYAVVPYMGWAGPGCKI